MSPRDSNLVVGAIMLATEVVPGIPGMGTDIVPRAMVSTTGTGIAGGGTEIVPPEAGKDIDPPLKVPRCTTASLIDIATPGAIVLLIAGAKGGKP
mmetsp:Transcript_71216/g.112787  ORF Transcript_71216/g.112787 Transcript_71216/m.112787 type:complete len:95 (+) Transcript_71216:320-604(+)